MGCREKRRQRTALGSPEKPGSVRTGCVHHGPDVIHALVEPGQFARTVRKAGAALVEHDDPCAFAELLEPACEVGFVPASFDMRNETGAEDQVDWTIAEDLVGNMDVTTPRVTRHTSHRRPFQRTSNPRAH